MEVEILWLIWSNEHNAWWRSNACGYTSDIKSAGRYPLSHARRICINANFDNANFDPHVGPNETMMSAPEFNHVIS